MKSGASLAAQYRVTLRSLRATCWTPCGWRSGSRCTSVLHDRAHRDSAGTPPCHLDTAIRRCRFLRPLETNKGASHASACSAGAPVKRHCNGGYALWQRRFWEHTIRNEFDFERHVDYVHFNPVKHKLVRRVRDWPYSSFHVFVRRGLLPADWAGDVDESLMDFGERRA